MVETKEKRVSDFKNKLTVLYTDRSFPIDEENVFISQSYRSVLEFSKENNHEYDAIKSYNIKHLLDNWGVSEHIENLESQKAKLILEKKDMRDEINSVRRESDTTKKINQSLEKANFGLTQENKNLREALEYISSTRYKSCVKDGCHCPWDTADLVLKELEGEK